VTNCFSGVFETDDVLVFVFLPCVWPNDPLYAAMNSDIHSAHHCFVLAGMQFIRGPCLALQNKR
jgi:hypothetical protein